jgi:hypothetical protein
MEIVLTIIIGLGILAATKDDYDCSEDTSVPLYNCASSTRPHKPDPSSMIEISCGFSKVIKRADKINGLECYCIEGTNRFKKECR